LNADDGDGMRPEPRSIIMTADELLRWHSTGNVAHRDERAARPVRRSVVIARVALLCIVAAIGLFYAYGPVFRAWQRLETLSASLPIATTIAFAALCWVIGTTKAYDRAVGWVREFIGIRGA
jgi:hypothetical protein